MYALLESFSWSNSRPQLSTVFVLRIKIRWYWWWTKRPWGHHVGSGGCRSDNAWCVLLVCPIWTSPSDAWGLILLLFATHAIYRRGMMRCLIVILSWFNLYVKFLSIVHVHMSLCNQQQYYHTCSVREKISNVLKTFVKNFMQLQCLIGTFRSNNFVNFVKTKSWIFTILLICEMLVPWLKEQVQCYSSKMVITFYFGQERLYV